MSKLRKIKYVQFQNHVKRTIELDEKVTTIVGPTDAGKSALLRGLRWLCLNQPTGDSFRGEFGDSEKTMIRLWVDQDTVSRIRSKTDNRYQLNGEEYRSFGSGNVPEAIADALNVSEVNFQQQLDQPYWLTETPGQLSKLLNAIVNLDVMDQTGQTIAAGLREAKAERGVIEKRIKGLEEGCESLSWVPDAERKLAAISSIEETIQKKKNRLDAIALDRGKIIELRVKLETKERQIEPMAKIVEKAERLDELRTRKEGLAKLCRRIREYREDVNVAIPDIAPIEALVRKRLALYARLNELEVLVLDKIQSKRKDLDWMNEDLKNLTEKIQQTGVLSCPTCGQNVADPSLFARAIGT